MARSSGLPGRMGSQTARRSVNFRFIGEAISELRRVTWPTREETMRLTIMVVAVAAAVGVFLGIVDVVFARLFDILLSN